MQFVFHLRPSPDHYYLLAFCEFSFGADIIIIIIIITDPPGPSAAPAAPPRRPSARCPARSRARPCGFGATSKFALVFARSVCLRSGNVLLAYRSWLVETDNQCFFFFSINVVARCFRKMIITHSDISRSFQILIFSLKVAELPRKHNKHSDTS